MKNFKSIIMKLSNSISKSKYKLFTLSKNVKFLDLKSMYPNGALVSTVMVLTRFHNMGFQTGYIV